VCDLHQKVCDGVSNVCDLHQEVCDGVSNVCDLHQKHSSSSESELYYYQVWGKRDVSIIEYWMQRCRCRVRDLKIKPDRQCSIMSD
jgi:hypothetical protein